MDPASSAATNAAPSSLGALTNTAEQAWASVSWVFGGVGIALSVLLLVLLRVVLPPALRRTLRFPVGCLVVHVLLVIARSLVGGDSPNQALLYVGALLALLLALGRMGFLLVVEVLLNWRGAEPMPRILKDILQGLVYVAGCLVALRAAGVAPGSLLTTSALLTAVVGLALQETLGNLVAGLAIQAQRPFDVGDWIQFDSDPRHVGQVMEINWRATTVLTQDRVSVVVPNGPLAKNSIANFSKPTPVVRRSVYVMASHTTPPSRVQAIILRALEDVPMVVKDPPPSVVTYQFKENGIEYWVRFFIERFDLRDAIDGRVRDRIWYALARAGIVYPLPAEHVHVHNLEAGGEMARSEEDLREVEDHLRRVDFLKSLDQTELKRLAQHVTLRLYAPGEIVIREGEAGAELFILQRGEVRVLVRGKEMTRLNAGAFFGEMSLLTGEPRTATVEAVGELEALVVGHRAFREVLNANPALAEEMSRTVAMRQQALDQMHDLHGQAEKLVATRSHQLLERIKGFFSLR